MTNADRPSFFHPSTKLYRFTLLIFVSLIPFGTLFSFDIFGAIAPTLVKEMGAARGTIGSFYTFYSIAAILSVVISGLVTDRLGPRKAGLIFVGLAVFGSGVVALAPTLPLLFLGRFIFGCGAEAIFVVILTICARWFKGKELALAMGITVAFGRLGTLFSFNTGELIAEYFGGFRYALYAAFFLCLFSLLNLMIFIILDRHGEKVLALKTESSGDKIVLRDIKTFPRAFWYVTILCVLFYSAIFPFTALSTDFFVQKWGIPRVAAISGGFFAKVFNNFLHMFSTAGGITSIVTFGSMIFAPFAGALVDKVGRRVTFMLLGPLLMIPSHLLLGFTHIYPAFPMLMLGIAFILFPAALWPSIPLVVDKDKTGTAFGLAFMIQNIGLGLFPLLNGLLRDATHTYEASMIMFASVGVLSLIMVFILKREDRRIGGVLEKP